MTTEHGLLLSELCRQVGDELIECHPMDQCIANVRLGTTRNQKGWTEITLKVWTQRLRPEHFTQEDQPYRGMVILMPTERVKAVLAAYDATNAEGTA